jgi:hypothetical protein
MNTEAQELPAPQQAPDRVVNTVPVSIHMKNGKTFVVDKIDGWVYEEIGVFATGIWKGYSGEKDVVIPYENVDYYELDFKALQRYLEKQEQAAASAVVTP